VRFRRHPIQNKMDTGPVLRAIRDPVISELHKLWSSHADPTVKGLWAYLYVAKEFANIYSPVQRDPCDVVHSAGFVSGFFRAWANWLACTREASVTADGPSSELLTDIEIALAMVVNVLSIAEDLPQYDPMLLCLDKLGSDAVEVRRLMAAAWGHDVGASYFAFAGVALWIACVRVLLTQAFWGMLGSWHTNKRTYTVQAAFLKVWSGR
jgi:hypothetical protein